MHWKAPFRHISFYTRLMVFSARCNYLYKPIATLKVMGTKANVAPAFVQ